MTILSQTALYDKHRMKILPGFTILGVGMLRLTTNFKWSVMIPWPSAR